MAHPRFVPLPGSERAALPGAHYTGMVDDTEPVDVTVILRRRAELPTALVEGPDVLARREFADRYGADPACVDLVCRAAREHGLEVLEADAGTRRVRLAGRLGALRGVVDPGPLSRARSRDPASGRYLEHRVREGALLVTPGWAGRVTAVLGLDDRPQARPYLRHLRTRASTAYSPLDLGSVYRFPQGVDGSGRTVALIELGGGFTPRELDAYFSGLGVSPAPRVAGRGVDGGTNAPEGSPDGADGQVLLDVEVLGALAPGARQLVHFAPNTAQGFVDALSAAVHADPVPVAVSIGWGMAENRWTAQARDAVNAVLADAAALGVTVCAASGVSGSRGDEGDGGPHTDFPASSPRALACGGTRLDADPVTADVRSETVWNDRSGSATGGGVSAVFHQPSWQVNAGVPGRRGGRSGRGVPDVAGDADPATGYDVLIDGRRQTVGGTAAVAPLWAALACRLSEALDRRLGMLQPLLYADAAPGRAVAGLRDITDGDNGDFRAGPGWDPCTGLGVPDGMALLARLRSGVGA